MRYTAALLGACLALTQNANGAVAAEDHAAAALKLYGWAQGNGPHTSIYDLSSKRTNKALLENYSKGANELNPHTGIVLASIDVPGVNTTYIELEIGGKKVWIASRITEVGLGDQVRFSPSEAVTLDNFESRVLKRNFEKIYFVPSISVTKADEQ